MTRYNDPVLVCSECWSLRMTSRPSWVIEATFRYRLTSRMLVSFLEGRVPWDKCAWVRRKSELSDWMLVHAFRLRNGRRVFPSMISLMSTPRITTELSVRLMKVHAWQVGSLQSGALRLAWSEGRFTAPAICLTEAWYLLTADRYVEIRGLTENSPRHSFSYDWTQGLLW